MAQVGELKNVDIRVHEIPLEKWCHHLLEICENLITRVEQLEAAQKLGEDDLR